MSTPLVEQRCLACGAPVEYEGYRAQRRNLVHHRFHCHACGCVYAMQAPSEKRPLFTVKPQHEVLEFSPYVPPPPDTCTYWG